MSHLEVYLPHIKKASLYQQIARWSKQKKIIVLKKGYYVTAAFAERNKQNPYFLSYIANVLRYPSYVTGSYVLQSYDALTDVTYPIFSATLKSSRNYSNALGEFIYHSLKPSLYTGYTRELFGTEPVYVATKSKALFDHLYIKYRRALLDPETILVRERLVLESFTHKELSEFKKYCRISGNKRIIALGEYLVRNAPSHE